MDIVLAEYLYEVGRHTPTAWEQKGLAVAMMTLVTLCMFLSYLLGIQVIRA